MHYHVYTHARTHLLQGRSVRVDMDTDRHTLNDLYKITGGVVRGQQGELGSCSAGERFDRSGDRLLFEGIHVNIHLLTDLDIAQLRFLEVSSDIDVFVYNREKRRTSL